MKNKNSGSVVGRVTKYLFFGGTAILMFCVLLISTALAFYSFMSGILTDEFSWQAFGALWVAFSGFPLGLLFFLCVSSCEFQEFIESIYAAKNRVTVIFKWIIFAIIFGPPLALLVIRFLTKSFTIY
jgi:hypothetical protein